MGLQSSAGEAGAAALLKPEEEGLASVFQGERSPPTDPDSAHFRKGSRQTLNFTLTGAAWQLAGCEVRRGLLP